MEAVREMKSSSAASCLRATGGFGRASPPDKEKEHELAGDGATGEGFRRLPLGLVSCGRNWSSNTGGLVESRRDSSGRPGDATMDCFEWNAAASHKTKWDAKMMVYRKEEEKRCVPYFPQSGE